MSVSRIRQNEQGVASVSYLIPGDSSRSFKAGLERGYQRAERQAQWSGRTKYPSRDTIVKGRPYWVHRREINDYLNGHSVGFHRFADGCWPNGTSKEGNSA